MVSQSKTSNVFQCQRKGELLTIGECIILYRDATALTDCKPKTRKEARKRQRNPCANCPDGEKRREDFSDRKIKGDLPMTQEG